MQFTKDILDMPTRPFANAVEARKKQGLEILSLGRGEPDFVMPAYIREAMIDAARQCDTGYGASQGLPMLRAYIADSLNSTYGTAYDASRVIIAPGVKSVLHLALCSLLDAGDSVVFLTPHFGNYPALVKMAEPTAKAVTVSLRQDYTLDLPALEKAVSQPRVKCLLINMPHNPTGAVLTQEDMDAVARLCSEHGVYLISDEVYEKLVYPGTIHRGFAAYPALLGRLLVLGGYSKSHAMAGLRIGYGAGPADLIATMNRLAQHLYTGTCTFAQAGACAAYTHDALHLPPYVEQLARRAERFHACAQSLRHMHGVPPHAGFFYFADISATRMDSNAYCIKLLEETGIAATPGIAFGDSWDRHVRFSLAAPDDVLAQAMERLARFDRAFS